MPQLGDTAFVSYSREDSEFALRLARDLKAAGAQVWLDQLDIQPGQRWARAVEEAMQAAPRMLVILSPSSVASPNVEDEVAFALEERKTVIPILYRDCKIPFRLRNYHYADFRANYERGLDSLLRSMGIIANVAKADTVSNTLAADETLSNYYERPPSKFDERLSSAAINVNQNKEESKSTSRSADRQPDGAEPKVRMIVIFVIVVFAFFMLLAIFNAR